MVEAYLAKTALAKSLELASNHLDEVREHQRETVGSCVKRLEAAHEAVKGLEREYDEILADAERLDLGVPDNREKLLARLDRYLRHENLRPVLVKAKAGLEESEVTLRANAESFFGVPRLRRLLRLPGLRTREEVVDHFAAHLSEVIQYIGSLNSDYLGRSYEGVSGVGLDHLLEIEATLKRPQVAGIPDASSKELQTRVQEIRAQRTHSRLLADADTVGKLTAKLEREFR
jgi:hypothetical protein